jgi:hypothetical protein
MISDRNRTTTARPVFEQVEDRRLMSVSASLAVDTLTITGSERSDVINVSVSNITRDGNVSLRGGTTSVFLDTATLASVGLELSGANTPGRPASSDFLVGFPILPSTDFKYAASPFAPVSGTIRHTGTVSFANGLTVGNFDIGFDPARAVNGATGFFVRNTVGALAGAVLFDVAAPANVNASVNNLNVGRANLLVSPELAGVLGNAALTGAVVGAARIDGLSTPGVGQTIRVFARGLSQTFSAASVANVNINTLGGSDVVNVRQLDLTGALRVNLGEGSDVANVDQIAGSSLGILGEAGSDIVNPSNSVFVSTDIATGGGRDILNLRSNLFTGNIAINGGGDRGDILLASASGAIGPFVIGFQRVFINDGFH